MLIQCNSSDSLMTVAHGTLIPELSLPNLPKLRNLQTCEHYFKNPASPSQCHVSSRLLVHIQLKSAHLRASSDKRERKGREWVWGMEVEWERTKLHMSQSKVKTPIPHRWFEVIHRFHVHILTLSCVFLIKLYSFWHSWKNQFLKKYKYENWRK
jgi:hypothetical protein